MGAARVRGVLLGILVGVAVLGATPPVAIAVSGAATPAAESRILLTADPRIASAKIRTGAVAALRRDLQDLSVFYGFSYRGPTRLVLADTSDEFARFAGPVSPDVLAVADSARRIIVVSPRSWRGEPARFDSVLLHEASHLVLDAQFREAGAAPARWLDEGLAMYVSSDWDFDLAWAEQQKETMDAAVTSGRLVPVGELGSLFAGDESDVRLAYAESYSFVAYLASAYGQRGLQRFVEAAAAPNATPDGASRRVFGTSLGRVEAAWRDSLARGTSWWAVLLDRTNLFVILWSLIAATVVVGFIIRTHRKREAYARMDAEERMARGDAGEHRLEDDEDNHRGSGLR